MGPNGSGKSTLAYVLAGREGYEVTGGEVRYEGAELLELAPEERAAAGLFLAFQYPVEIPGVANMYFLRTALNALRRARGEDEIDAASFMKLVREKAKVVGVKPELLKRGVNVGFSGGEKKRNEILQMAVLEPKLAILDETDSGPRHRCAAHRRRRRQQPARSRPRDRRDHALPAAARLHRAGPCACPARRPDRPLRRQGAGARARAPRLRRFRAGRRRRWPEPWRPTQQRIAPPEHYRALFGEALGDLPGAATLPCRRRREESFARFEAQGFPGAKSEAWKYTQLGAAREARVPAAAADRDRSRRRSAPFLVDDAAATLVFVNGRFAPDLSDALSAENGVTIASLDHGARARRSRLPRSAARR